MSSAKRAAEAANTAFREAIAGKLAVESRAILDGHSVRDYRHGTAARRRELSTKAG